MLHLAVGQMCNGLVDLMCRPESLLLVKGDVITNSIRFSGKRAAREWLEEEEEEEERGGGGGGGGGPFIANETHKK